MSYEEWKRLAIENGWRWEEPEWNLDTEVLPGLAPLTPDLFDRCPVLLVKGLEKIKSKENIQLYLIFSQLPIALREWRPGEDDYVGLLKWLECYHAERLKAKDRLSVQCPICGEKIAPREDSSVFEAAFEGRVEDAEAGSKILVSHARHKHTDYDEKVRELSAEAGKKYEELRVSGLGYYKRQEEIELFKKKIRFDERLENIRRTANAKAIESLKKHGGLK